MKGFLVPVGILALLGADLCFVHAAYAAEYKEPAKATTADAVSAVAEEKAPKDAKAVKGIAVRKLGQGDVVEIIPANRALGTESMKD